MKQRYPVSKIMTANPISINTSNSIPDVVSIFKEHNIRHIPVVSGEDLIGMISKTDIERISFISSFDDTKANATVYDMLSIEQIMTKQVEAIQSEDQVKDAAKLLAKGDYHALPVLDGKKLTGIVTSTDVINYLLDQY